MLKQDFWDSDHPIAELEGSYCGLGVAVFDVNNAATVEEAYQDMFLVWNDYLVAFSNNVFELRKELGLSEILNLTETLQQNARNGQTFPISKELSLKIQTLLSAISKYREKATTVQGKQSSQPYYRHISQALRNYVLHIGAFRGFFIPWDDRPGRPEFSIFADIGTMLRHLFKAEPEYFRLNRNNIEQEIEHYKIDIDKPYNVSLMLEQEIDLARERYKLVKVLLENSVKQAKKIIHYWENEVKQNPAMHTHWEDAVEDALENDRDRIVLAVRNQLL